MARKLKTYQTSLGFFDLAIAAPSMKAALEAWGADSNLFHQGAAQEVDDPAVVAATMASPGIVLKRPVGSKGAFKEEAELPKNLPLGKVEAPRGKPKLKSRAKTKAEPHRKSDDKAAREAIVNLEKERKRREAERRKEEVAREKKAKRQAQAVAKAEAVFNDAKRKHEAAIKHIEKERAALDERAQVERARWEKQKKSLEEDLRKAKS